MARTMADLGQALQRGRRRLDKTRYALRVAARFASSRLIFDKRLDVRIIDGRWRGGRTPRFLTIGRGRIDVADLHVNHTPGRTWVTVAQTSLYGFVRHHVFGERSDRPYKDYLATAFGHTEAEIAREVLRFESLIDSYVKDDMNIIILVRVGSDGLIRVADGAHRAAIVAALNPRQPVPCRIVVSSPQKRVTHRGV